MQSPSPSDLQGLAAALEGALYCDATMRTLYATDASVYRELPQAVALPETEEDILVNTGWSGGGYGVGKRIRLAYTHAIVDAIHSGALTCTPVQRDPVFGFEVVTECPGVPSEILQPRQTWADQAAYELSARKLAGLFIENFKKSESGVAPEVRAASPTA